MLLLGYPFIPKSPIHLISVGKFGEAKSIILKWSEREIAVEYWEAYQTSIDKFYLNDISGTMTILALFKHRHLRRITMISVCISNIIMCIYYGLSFNAAKLPGNLFVNNALNGQGFIKEILIVKAFSVSYISVILKIKIKSSNYEGYFYISANFENFNTLSGENKKIKTSGNTTS